MSAGQYVQFHATYIADRLAQYRGNLARGRIAKIVADVLQFCRGRLKQFSFQVSPRGIWLAEA